MKLYTSDELFKKLDMNVQFDYEGRNILVIIEHKTNKNGTRLSITTSEDDEVMDMSKFDNIIPFKQYQSTFWFKYGIPLVYLLRDQNVISHEEMLINHNCFFFAPMTSERTEWDVPPIKEDKSVNGLMTLVVYNEDGTFTHIPVDKNVDN